MEKLTVRVERGGTEVFTLEHLTHYTKKGRARRLDCEALKRELHSRLKATGCTCTLEGRAGIVSGDLEMQVLVDGTEVGRVFSHGITRCLGYPVTGWDYRITAPIEMAPDGVEAFYHPEGRLDTRPIEGRVTGWGDHPGKRVSATMPVQDLITHLEYAGALNVEVDCDHSFGA